MLLFSAGSIKAQDYSSKKWQIGLVIPVKHEAWSERSLWTGATLAYQGFTLNLFAEFRQNYFTSASGFTTTEYPWELLPRFSVGYLHTFGKSYDSPFKPMLGLYLLSLEGLEPDLDIGFQYKRMAFLISPHFHSRATGQVWFPSFYRTY